MKILCVRPENALITRNFLFLVTFDVKAGYRKSKEIGKEVGIKDMPNIYKLTLCLWTKFQKPLKGTNPSMVILVGYLPEISYMEGFALGFDTSKGKFFVLSEIKDDYK